MRNFKSVPLGKLSFSRYRQFNSGRYERILKLAQKLRNTKIFHINSAASGGGVAEILKIQVPLERNLGLDSKWLVMKAPEKYFEITKKIHNFLQGQPGALIEAEKRFYLSHAHTLGNELGSVFERAGGRIIAVIHDPQPLPMVDFLPSNTQIISRLHIDLSQPNKLVFDLLKPYIKKAHKVIISNKIFRPRWLSKKRTVISQPSISPFTPKNRYMEEKKAKTLLARVGVDTKRPLVTQISRLDYWKDPFGVIEAFYLAKKQFPSLQLLLEGVIVAKDDPEAKEIYRKLQKQCKHDKDIILLGTTKSLKGIPLDIFVNAAQRGSDIIIQKSIKEGFGMTVTEGMWKGKPVIGGAVGGIKLQIKDGQNGLLVNSPEECGEAIVKLLKSPRLRNRLGKNAHRSVRKRYLMDRLILDHLKIYRELNR